MLSVTWGIRVTLILQLSAGVGSVADWSDDAPRINQS